MPGQEPEDYRPRRASAADDPEQTDDDLDLDPEAGDEDSATGGPRTARTTRPLPRGRSRRQELLEDDDDPRPRLGPRARQLLMAVGVAVVVVAGLIFGYSALRVGQTPGSDPGPSGAVTPSAGGSTSAVEPVLDDAAMINADSAGKIDSKQTWQVASTQRGLDSSSPRPACLTGELADGQPTPQQIVLRLISGGSENAPAVLHEAEAYASPEDAAQAYAVLTKTVGGCSVPGAWVESGRGVTGVGDQASGVIVQLTDDGSTQYRSVLIARTGSVVDIVDVARAGSPAAVKGIALALADAVAVQCVTSGGACAENVSVTVAPPPLGGDEPGFLAAGDLPPVGASTPAWVGDPVDTPSADFTGSQCETVDWSTVEARERASRTYLQQDSAQTFGLDEIVITAESAKTARDLVAKVRKDLTTCTDRKLTAAVARPQAVRGDGAEDARVAGWTTTVRQRSTAGTATYRVAMVSVGSKAIYLFANPVKNLDFSDEQFTQIAIRAGQRASQV